MSSTQESRRVGEPIGFVAGRPVYMVRGGAEGEGTGGDGASGEGGSGEAAQGAGGDGAQGRQGGTGGQGQQGGATEDLQARYDRLQAQSRNWEKRAKDNAGKAKAFDEAEEKSKTEAQKLSDRAAAAEQRAHEAEQRAMRLGVASKKNLSASLADRLRGDTEDEMLADADAILRDLGRSGRPQGHADGGGSGRDNSTERSLADVVREQLGVTTFQH